MTEVFSPGLEGVIAGETAISTLEGGLSYRGYPVVELVERCDQLEPTMLKGERALRDEVCREFDAGLGSTFRDAVYPGCQRIERGQLAEHRSE